MKLSLIVAFVAVGCASTDANPGRDSGPSASAGSSSGNGSSGDTSDGSSSGSSGGSSSGSSDGVSGSSSGGLSGNSSGGSSNSSSSGGSSGSGVADSGGDTAAGSQSNDAADAAGDVSVGSPDAANASGGSADGSASTSQWYEAETIPPNVTTNGATATTCAGSAQYGGGATCPTSALQEGALCCSGGKVVVSLLGRAANNAGAGVEFHNVAVPSAGTYDVTWWYHCGSNDHFGDVNCGGLHYPVGTSCRPHLIDVNGVANTGMLNGAAAQFYQFPCYPGDWSIIHAATTSLPLKAGNNVIYIHPPHDPVLDAADIDVIHVTAVGQGTGPNITPVVGAN